MLYFGLIFVMLQNSTIILIFDILECLMRSTTLQKCLKYVCIRIKVSFVMWFLILKGFLNSICYQHYEVTLHPTFQFLHYSSINDRCLEGSMFLKELQEQIKEVAQNSIIFFLLLSIQQQEWKQMIYECTHLVDCTMDAGKK